MTVAVDQLSLSAANYLCPHCGAPIPLDDVNVATDLALCRKCGQTSPFSALAEAASAAHEPLTLPKGVSFDQTFDGFRIVCSTRSKTAFFIVPFMLIWSGVSVGGIYGTQLAKGHFNLMTSLFGIPFLLGTVALGCLSLMTVCGHVVIEKKGRLLECLTGVGAIGFRKRALWSAISHVREEPTGWANNGQTQWRLLLEGDERVSFATGMSVEHRYYVVRKLNALLPRRG